MFNYQHLNSKYYLNFPFRWSLKCAFSDLVLKATIITYKLTKIFQIYDEFISIVTYYYKFTKIFLIYAEFSSIVTY